MNLHPKQGAFILTILMTLLQIVHTNILQGQPQGPPQSPPQGPPQGEPQGPPKGSPQGYGKSDNSEAPISGPNIIYSNSDIDEDLGSTIQIGGPKKLRRGVMSDYQHSDIITENMDGTISWNWDSTMFEVEGLTITVGGKTISMNQNLTKDELDNIVKALKPFMHNHDLKSTVQKIKNIAILQKLANNKKVFEVEKDAEFDGDIELTEEQTLMYLKNFLIRKNGHHLQNTGIPKELETKKRDKRDVREPIVPYKLTSRHRSKRKVKPSDQWDLPINYHINRVYNPTEAAIIKDGVKLWSDNTCMRFRQQSSVKAPYPLLHFNIGQGCSANVGKWDSGPNEISLNKTICVGVGTVAHEIGHALGLWHEQSRPDRDSYVDVLIDNVYDASRSNYARMMMYQSNNHGVKYDLGSVMHYGTMFTSKNKKSTMLPKDPRMNNVLGQRAHPSDGDYMAINMAFCSKACTPYRSLYWSKCQNGGYRDPNNCGQCRCLDGFGGKYCDEPASYKIDKCGGELTATALAQTQESPGYGGKGYESYQECTWWIKAPEDHLVEVRLIENFFLPCLGDVCVYDWVELRMDSIDELGERYCCRIESSEKEHISRFNEAMVLLRSSSTTKSNYGFKFQYRAVKKTKDSLCKKLKLSGVQIEAQKHSEGIYELESRLYNDKPVYKCHLGENFIYYYKGNSGPSMWAVSPIVGSKSMGMYSIQRKLADVFYPERAIEWKSSQGPRFMTDRNVKLTCAQGYTSPDLVLVNGDGTKVTGVYKKLPSSPLLKPKYKHIFEEFYIFNHLEREWHISTVLGDASSRNSVYKVADDALDPCAITKYWIGNKALTIEEMKGSEIPCTKIEVTGTRSMQARKMGVFIMEPALSDHRLVYKHESQELYLYHISFDFDLQYWMIGSTAGETSAGVKGVSSSVTPLGTALWEVWSFFDWADDKDLTLKCLDETIDLKIFNEVIPMGKDDPLPTTPNTPTNTKAANPCLTGNNRCAKSTATCLYNGKSYSCKCKTGHTGNGFTCRDTNECTTRKHNCHLRATCLNNVGSFTCKCKPGYTGDGVTCKANKGTNECATGQHDCHTHATCEDTITSYRCKCKAGYTGNGKTCKDIDECATKKKKCSGNAHCINTIGSSRCQCNDGFRGNGVFCRATVNECAKGIDKCDKNAICTDTVTSYRCSCKTGFRGTGYTCTAISSGNEIAKSGSKNSKVVTKCTTHKKYCHLRANCLDTPDGHKCECKLGYSGNGRSCLDINECKPPSKCSSNSYCRNTAGSFVCTCKSGFKKNGNKCVDVNECTLGKTRCHKYADCTNTIGSYKCRCKSGYKGTGYYCRRS